jgi:hypothetical protein
MTSCSERSIHVNRAQLPQDRPLRAIQDHRTLAAPSGLCSCTRGPGPLSTNYGAGEIGMMSGGTRRARRAAQYRLVAHATSPGCPPCDVTGTISARVAAAATCIGPARLSRQSRDPFGLYVGSWCLLPLTGSITQGWLRGGQRPATRSEVLTGLTLTCSGCRARKPIIREGR